ncbi:hypothetical protein Ciccas_002715 [Cichlidogyrus casuarinus]|uniref:FLYWCH-type domain-containing protein n=1 Tax=Cichlidogyrus casuarinus TaxID=1844966 RepID=A0ABD2QGG1_9PLAT
MEEQKYNKWTNSLVHVAFDITRKGERSLVVDGFKFTKSRDGMCDRTFWRCSRRECKATAVTVADKVEHVRSIHAHEPPLPAEFFSNVDCAASSKSGNGNWQSVRFFNTPASPRRVRMRRHTEPQNVTSPVPKVPWLTLDQNMNVAVNPLYDLANAATKQQDCNLIASLLSVAAAGQTPKK